MGTARGYKSQCVLDFESTFATDPGTPAGHVMPINTFGVKSSQNKTAPATIRGTRNPAAPFAGNVSVAGSVQVPVGTDAFAFWLKAMFGAPTTTGTDPYTHVFKIGDSQPSLVLENKLADPSAVIKYAKYNGCKIGSWKMSIGGDGELVSDFDIVGAKETLSGSAYDAAATEESLDRLNNFQAALTEGGSSIAIVTAMDFTVDFGLDTDKYVIGGGGILGDIPEGLIKVSGNISALFQNDTLLNKAINNTESSLVVTITDGANSLAIAFNELQYARNTPGIEGPQGVLISLPWEAYYDDHADESAVEVTLVNTNDGTDYA